MPQASWSEYLIVLALFLVMFGLILLFMWSPWKRLFGRREAEKPPEGSSAPRGPGAR